MLPSTGRSPTRGWWRGAAVFAALLLLPLCALVVLRPRPTPAPAAGVPVAARGSSAPPVDGASEGFRLVTGSVKDDAGEPIGAARVVVVGRAALQARSSPDGSFRLSGAPVGPIELEVTAAGYGEARVAVARGQRGGREFVEVALKKALGVGGVVLDPEGRPLFRASVRCADRDDPLQGSLTDSDGRFTLGADAAGCQAVARHGSFADSEPVTLRPGNGNRLRLGRGGSIDGEVVDERGRPIASFTIAIETYRPSRGGHGDRGGPAKQVSDPAGRFVLDGLAAGRYVLTASAPGRPPVHSEAVDVDSDRRRVRIELPAGGVMTGKVLDQDGAAIAGARVQLDLQTMTAAAPVGVTSAADGSYRLEGLPRSAPFSVSVAATGYNRRIVSGLRMPPSGSHQQDIALGSTKDGGGGIEYSGIGASVGAAPGGIRLGQVFDGGPAAKAGLQRDDVLVRIDGRDTTEMSVAEAIQLLRGPDGSSVRLSVRRGTTTRDYVLVRRAIDL